MLSTLSVSGMAGSKLGKDEDGMDETNKVPPFPQNNSKTDKTCFHLCLSRNFQWIGKDKDD